MESNFSYLISVSFFYHSREYFFENQNKLIPLLLTHLLISDIAFGIFIQLPIHLILEVITIPFTLYKLYLKIENRSSRLLGFFRFLQIFNSAFKCQHFEKKNIRNMFPLSLIFSHLIVENDSIRAQSLKLLYLISEQLDTVDVLHILSICNQLNSNSSISFLKYWVKFLLK